MNPEVFKKYYIMMEALRNHTPLSDIKYKSKYPERLMERPTREEFEEYRAKITTHFNTRRRLEIAIKRHEQQRQSTLNEFRDEVLKYHGLLEHPRRKSIYEYATKCIDMTGFKINFAKIENEVRSLSHIVHDREINPKGIVIIGKD